MAYTNSSLVNYTKISPNKTSPRNHSIDRITPHCYVGQASVESMAGWLCNPGAKASANYGIGQDGRVCLLVEEKDRSWCSSSSANDNRAVTIECASDVKEPYTINDTVYNKLIDLMTDICKRYGKKKLLWLGDKEKTLAHQPAEDEMVITVHRWFANKACPGDYIYNRLGKIAETVTKRLGGVIEEENVYTTNEWIAMIAPIAQDLARKYYVLPSVVIAQTALETGWGRTDLTRKYNIIGMKADLINSTWKSHSTWDGTTYMKVTPEYVNGKLIHKEDVFRVYKTFRECLEDYVNFLLYVRNDKGYKYRRLQNLTDPKTVINIIKVGTGTDDKPEGYCTDPNYEIKILNLIKEYDLTRFDKQVDMNNDISIQIPETVEVTTPPIYRIQCGAFTNKENAKKRVAELKKAGIEAFYSKVHNIYKVQAGAFVKKSGAKKHLMKIRAAGFKDAFITT